MEWKRAKGGVAVQACDDDLVKRVEIAGDYDNNQCGVTLLGVQGEDAGLWECEMEEYQFTDLLGGEKHSHNFTVVVEEKLATVTEITTTKPFETTIEPLETTIEPFETTIDGSEATEENEMTPPHTTTDKQIVTHNIEALPIDQDQTEQQEPDDAPVVGISIGVSLVIVLAAASVVGILWKKKQNNLRVVSLQKLREEEACCTNVAMEEVEVTKVTMSDLMEK